MPNSKEEIMRKSISDIVTAVTDLTYEKKYTQDKIENIEKGITNIQATLERNYVTFDKHALLQAEVQRQGKILYFAISVFAGAVLLAIANLVIQKP